MHRSHLILLLVGTCTIIQAVQEQLVSIESIGMCSLCAVYSRLYGCCGLEPRLGKESVLPEAIPEDASKNGDRFSKTYDAQQLLNGE